MGFAILRTQKLKSPVAVLRSAKHALREQDTPNADPTKTAQNTHFGAATVAEVMERFNERLPEKYRKDAVLCVEYLVTASPEAMASKSRPQQDAYFEDALKWLQARHGAENVVYAGIHRDETTPHLYAYVVPRDGEKLNCRKWLGGSKALSQMQTEFAQSIGKAHSLERGVERSKARHVSIRQYYARVNAPVPQLKALDLPEPKLLEGKQAYGERVAESVRAQLNPAWLAMQDKVKQASVNAIDLDKLRGAVQSARLNASSAQHELEMHRSRSDKAIAAVKEDAQRSVMAIVQAVIEGGPALARLQQDLRRDFSPDRGNSPDQGVEQ